MTVRPIIFSGPMVRALLEGRKTQTRRLLKPQPPKGWKLVGLYAPGLTAVFDCDDYEKPDWTSRLRYAVGDLLYVRETWAPLDRLTHNDPGATDLIYNGFYKADEVYDCGDISKWTPAIHHPRRASRLTLEVTNVRVERLQDISEEDARAEGVESDSDGWRDYQMPETQTCPTADYSFHTLWDSLNAKRGYGWDTNPYVVAVTFKVHQQNVDALLKSRAA